MIALAVVLIVMTYRGVFDPAAMVGPLTLRHWMSITGGSIVTLLIPVYRILKRRRPKAIKSLLTAHIFGNLSALQFISVHFAAHYSQGYDPVVDTGTGFLLFFVVASLVATGVFRRFQVLPGWVGSWKFLHVSLAVSFYLVFFRHMLRALRIF